MFDFRFQELPWNSESIMPTCQPLMETVQPVELEGLVQERLLPERHRVRPEQHSRERKVPKPEPHRMVPLEHTQQEQHSLEPWGHRLEHKQRLERHSLVSRHSTSPLELHTMASSNTGPFSACTSSEVQALEV